MGAGRGARARRGRERAVGGADAREDVGDARHAAPAARRRAERCGSRPCARASSATSSTARARSGSASRATRRWQLIAAIGEALDGRELTRAELAAAVGDERLLESWGSMLKPAAAARRARLRARRGPEGALHAPGLVARGPRRGARGGRRAATSAPAGRRRARTWRAGGAPRPAEGGRMLKALGDEVAPVTVEGAPMWLLREHVAEAAAAEPLRSVRLLPGFDQYVIAATRHAEALMPGRVQGARAPPAGLDLPRAARRGPDGRRLAPRAQGQAPARRGRAVRARAEVGARRPPRPRRSASPASSAARSSWPGSAAA